MWLACVAGALSGRRVPVGTSEVTVGRDPSNTIVIDDPSVSRRHARIFMRGADALIVDLDSKGGTFVNDYRISLPTNIDPSSVIRIGQSAFRLERPQAPPSIPPPVPQIQAAPSGPAPMFIAHGRWCELQLFEDRVRIVRKGGVPNLILHGLKGDKEILLRALTGIQFRPPGSMTVGYIQFTVPGGIESKAGILDATHDENTVLFMPEYLHEFVQIKNLIDVRISEVQRPQQVNNFSPADELLKLAELLRQGHIDQSQFDAQKKKLGF